MDNFISEDDLLSFEGFLKYQAVDAATMTPDELKKWREIFEEAMERSATSPKVGLMKLHAVPGEQRYAVAIQDGSDLWLTLWVRCSRKGEVFIMYPRSNREWDGYVSINLMEPGCEPAPVHDDDIIRYVYPRRGRPSLVITVARTALQATDRRTD